MESLLQTGDGKCGPWARLFKELLAVHRITNVDLIEIYPDDSHIDSLGYRWTKAFEQTYGYTPPTGRIIGERLYIKKWDAADRMNGQDINDEGDIKAQGNNHPQSVFENHGVVRYGSQYYDPSYGGEPFSDFKAWEDRALDGIGIDYDVPAAGTNPRRQGQWIGVPNNQNSLETKTNVIP